MREKDYRRINSVVLGETIKRPVYVEKLIQKETKNKDPYVELHVCDSDSSAKMNKFQSSDGRPVTIELLNSFGITENSIIMMEIGRSKEGKFYEVVGMGPNTDTDVVLQDFAHVCDGDANERFDNICSMLSSVSEERKYLFGEENTLSDLAINLLKMYKDKICWSAAAEAMHSEKAGGLMEHTEAMVRNAVSICNVYPDLDKDLLVAGTALHDIGKIEELITNELGSATYTPIGIAIGHIVMGYTIVDRYVERNTGGYPDERIMLLETLILSHHGKKEYGSPVEPVVPEAFMLNYIDMIDATYHEMKNAKSNLNPGEISPDNKVPGIKHRIYHPKEEV